MSYNFFFYFLQSHFERNSLVPVYWDACKAALVYYRYAKRGPPHSFIHVDDFSSPKELAAYITYLDGNDTAYQEYHAWKFEYERTCPSLNFFCNFCQKLYNVQGNTLLFTSRMILQVIFIVSSTKTEYLNKIKETHK